MNKYQYNALCDVCGFKMKASMLRKRWDGFMVCDKDWEPRNILDFYRTRNDAHLLPFTRPDDNGDNQFTPTVTGFSGTYTITGVEYHNSATGEYYVKYQLVPTSGTVVLHFNDTIVGSIAINTIAQKGGTIIGATTGKLYGTTTGAYSGGHAEVVIAQQVTTTEPLLITMKGIVT